MTKHIAVYPGSFDPPTYGHIDLIQRAVKIFDTLIVGVAENNAKAALFSVDERISMIKRATPDLKGLEITSFSGLTVDFAKKSNASALVRGLRVVSDFEYELTLAIANQKLNNEIDTVLLMPREDCLLVSSRLVKEIAQFGGALEKFVPDVVASELRRKFVKG